MILHFDSKSKTLAYGETVFYPRLSTPVGEFLFHKFDLPNSVEIHVFETSTTVRMTFVTGDSVIGGCGSDTTENAALDALIANDTGTEPLKVLVGLVVFIFVVWLLWWLSNQGLMFR